jgi:hypothetical protein
LEDFEPFEKPPRPLHWTIRLVLGLFFAFCALFCFAVSWIPILDPQSDSPSVNRLIGVVMAFLSLWVFSLAMRLLLNRPNLGGLLSPFVLRLISVYLVAMPIFLLVTGRTSSWAWWQYLQAVLFVFSGLGLWLTAAWRKASNVKA